MNEIKLVCVKNCNNYEAGKTYGFTESLVESLLASGLFEQVDNQKKPTPKKGDK